MQVIVMGVSGSGKSLLARALVAATGWAFAEGDDFHTPENKARMAAGIPLTDADRAPWLDALHAVLVEWRENGVNGVMTCSALKEIYRERLMDGLPDLRFAWLDPPRAVLQERMAHRKGHYMPAALLDSQIATLERPAESESVLRLGGLQSPDEEIGAVLKWLSKIDDSTGQGIRPIQ